MAIEIEFRRHSIRDGANPQMIGPLGYKLTRLAGEHQLLGKNFSHFFVSPLYRTHQTLAAFAEGAQDFDLKYAPPVAPLNVVSSDTQILWKTCWEASKNGVDLMGAAFSTHAEIAEKVAVSMTDLFKTWSSEFADNSRILVVGHSPALELMLYGATGIKIPSLSFCEGFRIIKKGEELQFVHGIPELSSSELIRKMIG